MITFTALPGNNFLKFQEDLNFFILEDSLIFFLNVRQPYFFIMEDNLNFLEI